MSISTLISIILALATPVIGVRSVFQGEYKPQRMTRFLGVILSSIIFASLVSQHAGIGLYLAGIQLFGTLVYFALSFKYGMGGTTRLDFAVLIGVILILCLWYLTNDPLIALVASVCTYTLAFFPTFLKTWKLPYTESWPFYGCDVAAALVTLIALGDIFARHAVFAWYVFFLNLTMVLIIISRRIYLK